MLRVSAFGTIYRAGTWQKPFLRALFCAACCLPLAAWGQGIDKGFEALRIGDYFRAKEVFEKYRKSKPIPASYGLCKLFATRELNRFYSPDSALPLVKALHAELEAKKKGDAKFTDRLAKDYGFAYADFLNLKDTVAAQAFELVQRKNTHEAYEQYINDYGSYRQLFNQPPPQVELARQGIYALAFAEVKQMDSYPAYKGFYEKYPRAPQADEARALYEQRLFETVTAKQTPDAYAAYMAQYPKGAYYKAAEDSLYQKSTRGGSARTLAAFARAYPKHPKAPVAWQAVYDQSTDMADPQSFLIFLCTYKDYPHPQAAKNDYRAAALPLLPVRQDSLWGYADTSGLIAIQPRFTNADDFIGGLALQEQNGKYGYLNKKGALQIACIYDDAEHFENGVAVVSQNKKFGLIDTKGNYLLSLQYDGIGDFNEGLAAVRRGEVVGFANVLGQVVVPIVYKDAGNFSEGLAWVRTADSVGYINAEGRVVLAARYTWADDFTGGIARVRRGEWYGAIDTAGRYILPPEYKFIGKPSEGMLLVVKDKKFGYANRAGKLVVPLVYDYTESVASQPGFANGMALVQVALKPAGYAQGLADSAGRVVVKPRFDRCGPIAGGLAPVEWRKKWGYVNRQDKLVVAHKYDVAFTLAGAPGYAGRVALAGKMGYVDSTGREMIPPLYDEAEDFKGPLARVKKGGKLGYITRRNEPLVPLEVDKAEPVLGLPAALPVLRLHRNGKIAYYHTGRHVFLWREAYYNEK